MNNASGRHMATCAVAHAGRKNNAYHITSPIRQLCLLIVLTLWLCDINRISSMLSHLSWTKQIEDPFGVISSVIFQ